MGLPVQLLLLLPVSVAAGLDLYLTTLAVATATLLGFEITGGSLLGIVGDPAIPPWVGPSVVLGLGVLYLAEAFAESRPILAFLWHNLQLFLRPVGASLLGLYLLWGQPPLLLFGGAAVASIVAAFVHVLFWGQTILLRMLPRRRLSAALFSLAADIAAAVLLALTFRRPELGFLLAMLALLVGLVFGRGHHGAVRFGLALLVDAAWGIVSPTRWHSVGGLPSWVREGTAGTALAGAPGTRGGTWGVTGRHRFSDGWILQRDSDLFFVYRRARAVSVVALAGIEEGVKVGALWKTIRYRSEDGTQSALFLQVGLYGSESHK